MEINYKEICEEVCRVAKKAGEFIRKERETFSDSEIEVKSSQNDLVTYVDKQSEVIIVGELRGLIEDARFITEEKTVESGDSGSSFCWVIDPIDGTTNFAHGLAPYCVSIALMEGDEVVVGVIYEVAVGECFYAWKGSDTFLNGKKIEVSHTQTLAKSLVATGMAIGSESRYEEFYKLTKHLMLYTHGFRRTGSAAANLAFVAVGRIDAFAQFGLSPWDVAAGVFIAERAGAIVTDYKGGKDYIFGKEVIAANPNVYSDYKELTNSFL